MSTGRFAPSPSGRMHLGNLFCCLLAWLSAKKRGGRVILRIEDLDIRRCPPENGERLMDDLLWLGLDWDEGPRRGGPHGPYEQSRRTALYEAALEELRARGLVYPCFCTRGELHAASAPHLSDGRVLYSGACRNLTAAQRRERARLRPPAFRLRVPEEEIAVADGHMGLYRENLARECGDFLLRRSDGLFAYQLAVVVDDGAMGVEEVVRGADLLSSTPRQLYLYRLLGLTPPAFYHLPLLLAPGGRRLSKREADVGLDVLREKYAPEEIVGRLAFLGGFNPERRDGMPRDFLDAFAWSRVPREDIPLEDGLF